MVAVRRAGCASLGNSRVGPRTLLRPASAGNYKRSMSNKTQDFQKREAKRCLWDQDGDHTKKRYRNKGKGRGKDKRLIKEEQGSDG